MRELAPVVAYFAFSAVVSGMPEPDDKAPLAYKWAYHTLHILSGDLSHVLGSRLKGLQ